MTISTTQNRYSYAGNGSTLAFSYASKFLANADLVVLLVDSDGASATQVLDTDFTVTGAGVASGGTVTMTVAPAVGETLVIYGDPEITQTLDLVNNDSFDADDLEETLDRSTLINQRQAEKLDRSLRLADADTAVVDTELNTTNAAGKYLRLNTDGDGFEFITASPDDDTFTQSGTGAVARSWTSKVGQIEVTPQDFGGVADGATESAADIAQAVTSRTASGGEVKLPPSASAYSIGSTLTLPSLVSLVGEGDCSVIKLASGSNTDMLRTTSFSTLTGQNKWLVGADGMIYGFRLERVRFDGNKANQSSGDGVKIYGKGYTINDVTIHDVKGVGFYSEAGAAGGQSDYRDMPESAIGPLSIFGCGSHNFQFRGPHDAYISELYSSSAGTDGCRFEGDGSTYSGLADIGIIHSYAAGQYGVYTNSKLKAAHLIGETCVKEGIYIDSAASNCQIGLLEAYANDSGDTSTYWNALIAAQQCVVNNAVVLDSNSSAGGIKITGASTQISDSVTNGSGNANAAAIGVEVDAASVTYKGKIVNYTTAGQTGLRTSQSSGRSNLMIDANIENCAVGWNNVNATQGGSYRVRISSTNKDHLLFTGAGPGTYDPSAGTGVRARDSWDVIAVNTGTSHSGTAAAGGAGTITLASTAATTDDVYNGAICTITGGTGSGAVGVVTDYVGSTKVATVQAVNGTTFTTDGTSTYTMSSLTLASNTSGTATIPSGSTSIRLPHGLLITSITPTARNIKVTPTNNKGSAAEFWISAVDKTTFTITVDADPTGSGATFAWDASLD